MKRKIAIGVIAGTALIARAAPTIEYITTEIKTDQDYDLAREGNQGMYVLSVKADGAPDFFEDAMWQLQADKNITGLLYEGFETVGPNWSVSSSSGRTIFLADTPGAEAVVPTSTRTFEGKFDVSAFTGTTSANMFGTANTGNSNIVSFDYVIPEPVTVGLLGLGTGLLWVTGRNKRRAS